MKYKNIPIKSKLNEAKYFGHSKQPNLPTLTPSVDYSIGLAGQRPAREKFNTLLHEVSDNIMYELALDDSDTSEDMKDVIEGYLREFAKDVLDRFVRGDIPII